MGIFQRLGDLLKSNVNDLIDKAEDPEKMAKQLIIDMQKELNTATQSYGKAKASEKMAERDYDEAVRKSQEWENKAKAALSQGDEKLAKKALEEKVDADKNVERYKEMYETVSAQTKEIGEQVEELKSKLEEAKSKQAMLIARSRMADTKKELAKSTGSFDSSASFEKFEQMEEKIERKEAEAEAYAEIADAGTDRDEAFEDVEKKAKVDSELQRLMSEMNGNKEEQ